MTTSQRTLALDIGSNSVGSMWFDHTTGNITTGTSIFPAGVDETDEKRGDPKNAKRRMTRRTRITLRRRAERKRELRLKLIESELLPSGLATFKVLLEQTDPWSLRREGLDKPLTPHQFGRVLLHLAQRRGALGLKPIEQHEDGAIPDDDDGKVKAAIGAVRVKMLERKARTFGEFIAMVRGERVHKLPGPDPRPKDERKGPREYRDAVRNKAANYEHCADREMIRDEFARLWDAQKRLGGETGRLLNDKFRKELDDETGDSTWRHKGLLFGQRRQTWDLGTLGRCVLEPTERCAPHADVHASRYLVVETVNNLKIIERGKSARPLTPEERAKIRAYLSGPLGMYKPPKRKGVEQAERPKTSVSVTDLRELMGWGKATKTTPFRFNIEADEDKQINTDWFSREIVHGAIGAERWAAMPESIREGINRAILRHDPEQDGDAAKLKTGVMKWTGLREAQADALVAAWTRRPKPDAKRLNMSRRAVLNLLTVMDRPDPWPEAKSPSGYRWLDQTTARRWLAEMEDLAEAASRASAPIPTAAIADGKPKQVPQLDAAGALSLGAELSSTAPTRRAFVKAMKARGIEPDGHLHSDYFRVLRSWESQRGIGKPEPAFGPIKLRRYSTGAKGATASDRHYMGKHVLMKDGKPVIGPDGHPLAEPPPAPLISNPVVRKAIHEVRRHVVEYMTTFGRKPDKIYVELAREARMGAVDADRLLFRNRLRNRIRRSIIDKFGLDSRSPAQQRAAVDRVALCMQQGGASANCPLCGKGGLTPRKAAEGEGCEVAHIIPKGSGGHNGLGNIVLAHAKCNRDMGRRTPRQFWSASLKGGFDEGFRWIEGIYGEVGRPKPSEVRNAEGDSLWVCYFDGRDDKRKIVQFAKDIKDIQDMTARQEAATKYAARQVLAYLSDALYGGKGLPERATGGGATEDERRIFATDGLWTSRFRREWGLFFDPHHAKAKGLSNEDEHQRKEKNRGDHRHHAIDAIVIGLSTRSVQASWEEREKTADKAGINTADEEKMENYRRLYPLDPPAPYKSVKEFREAVKAAVFGDTDHPRPISHRPVKRKLIGALHEETLFGPVLDRAGKPTGNYTAKKGVLALTPNHLCMPEGWDDLEVKLHDGRVSDMRKREIRRDLARMVDPAPGKPGIVRDRALRNQLRKCLRKAKLDPDKFTVNEIKRLAESGGIGHESGVPIRSVVLLRSMRDPVLIDRKRPDYATGRMVVDEDPASKRAYVGGNNHHIELRIDAEGRWSGDMVSMFEASQRKLAFFRALRASRVPRFCELKNLPKGESKRYSPLIAAAEKAHPLVDRSDKPDDGGRFVMSLCEGEMVHMLHKEAKKLGYFVVAKLDKPNSVVLVPHWDARTAGERKGPDGQKIPDSQRDSFTATPDDFKTLAPPGKDRAVKVRVSPLGRVTVLDRD